MVKTYIPPDDREVVCPACGAEIKTPPSSRNRRVQCPKCREVVVIESVAESDTGKKKRPVPASDSAAASKPSKPGSPRSKWRWPE
jgi:Zn-finger nucleic acid-binding protein